jgi:2-oxoglutarate ferredoxin oxidoreductase subunit alpha
MTQNNFNWKIGGEAGYGIMSAGAMFSRAMLRAGQFVFDYTEYPSLIRGGHNTYEVSVSPDPIFGVRRPIHILVALNRATIDYQKIELSPNAIVIFNSDNTKAEASEFAKEAVVIGIPMEKLSIDSGAERVGRNTVALGASFAACGVPFDRLKEIIELNFSLKKKDGKVAEVNIKAAKAGYEHVRQKLQNNSPFQLKIQDNPGRLLMSGNDALSWGAIKAGCNFYSGYPMTPSTSILHVFAAQAPKYSMVVKHTEDEITAICAAIGAGYTGVRSMTATSGGGFALMVEALGMAGMVEVPLVIVESMRPGPSTGMPTWTGQEDLKFVLSASQGEFPRVVVAPGDVEQSYQYIQQAFNIAEEFQTPVVVMMDKYLGSSHKWVNPKELKNEPIKRGMIVHEKDLKTDEPYLRYLDTVNGVSPRTLPGTKGGMHIANSDEHNEKSFTEEDASERARMMDKRFKKEAAIAKNLPNPELEGEKNADLTLITWGSAKGPVQEAIHVLKLEGKKVNMLQIVFISPFPTEKVQEVMKKAKKIAIVENNKTGQLAGWLREQTGLAPDYKILKYDGRPFFAHELVETIKELL